MARGDEKAEAIRTSHEIPGTSHSLKEENVENPATAYLPQSDEEYNVTLKTWCVVVVSQHR
jgi:hypothetical protein